MVVDERLRLDDVPDLVGRCEVYSDRPGRRVLAAVWDVKGVGGIPDPDAVRGEDIGGAAYYQAVGAFGGHAGTNGLGSGEIYRLPGCVDPKETSVVRLIVVAQGAASFGAKCRAGRTMAQSLQEEEPSP
ncbi:MAG: hypothetical protein QJR00_04650 [Bacillota bacterium]|nr:hypothetical protein [Bacillota bacterium]